MSNPAIKKYYAETITALKALHDHYHFEKKYGLEDETVIVEFSHIDSETKEVKNLSLEELIFGTLTGLDPYDIQFNLYHVQISTVYCREEKSVSRGKVLHSLNSGGPELIFNMFMEGPETDNNYKWNYMGEDNVLHSCTDLDYLLVTFWPSGDLFKETAKLVRDILDALTKWCPDFGLYKEEMENVAFK